MTYVLWAVQVPLALLFLYSGGIDLLLSLTGSGWFRLLIGVAKILGAFGLILPGLFRVRPDVTPLAAAGLTLIIVRATVVTLVRGHETTPEEHFTSAIVTRATGVSRILGDSDPYILSVGSLAVVGLLTAFVAYGRWRLARHPDRIPGAPTPRVAAKSGLTLIVLGTVVWILLALDAFLNWPLRQEARWGFAMIAIVAVPIGVLASFIGTVIFCLGLAGRPTRRDVAIVVFGVLGIAAPIVLVLIA